eukprot:Rmarinus@m.6869
MTSCLWHLSSSPLTSATNLSSRQRTMMACTMPITRSHLYPRTTSTCWSLSMVSTSCPVMHLNYQAFAKATTLQLRSSMSCRLHLPLRPLRLLTSPSMMASRAALKPGRGSQ